MEGVGVINARYLGRYTDSLAPLLSTGYESLSLIFQLLYFDLKYSSSFPLPFYILKYLICWGMSKDKKYLTQGKP
jgi:hypothetical protein